MPLAPPSPPAFPAGYGPFPADFNGWIQNTLGFQTTGIVFRAEQTAAQAIGAGNNIINFNTVLEDPYSGWNAGTFTWLAPFTGWYEVTVTATTAVIATAVSAQVKTPETYANLETLLTTAQATFFGGASGYQIVPLLGGSDTVQGGIAVANATTTNATSVGTWATMEIAFISQ